MKLDALTNERMDLFDTRLNFTHLHSQRAVHALCEVDRIRDANEAWIVYLNWRVSVLEKDPGARTNGARVGTCTMESANRTAKAISRMSRRMCGTRCHRGSVNRPSPYDSHLDTTSCATYRERTYKAKGPLGKGASYRETDKPAKRASPCLRRQVGTLSCKLRPVKPPGASRAGGFAMQVVVTVLVWAFHSLLVAGHSHEGRWALEVHRLAFRVLAACCPGGAVIRRYIAVAALGRTWHQPGRCGCAQALD